jgi:hypothetical protein
MLRMMKFGILFGLLIAGCMTASDNATCTDKTITIHDTTTVQVVKSDTLRLHDTVKVTLHDTLRIHDTTKVTIHDTILAGLQDPSSLFGVWTGQAGGKAITLAFTSTLVTINAADFSANVGATAISGYVGQVDSAQAKITWGGFHDVTWLIDLKNGVLTIQEIGDQMFPGGAVTLRKR